jgi:ribosomal protein S18 acetylase RimI-like enzyme
MNVQVRKAKTGDGPVLLRLVMDLARHHGEEAAVTATAGQLEAVLCSPSETRGCLVATVKDNIVGFAYWYLVFTTFAARDKVYLEDLVVEPGMRGSGIARALMRAVSQECVERDLNRLEWLAMDSNEAGNRFYRSIGGEIRNGAQTWQLPPDMIRALAGGGPM